MLTGPVPGEPSVAGEEAENVRVGDGLAVDAFPDMSGEEMQLPRTTVELRAVVLAPGNIGIDHVPEHHVRPSRSMLATSRSVPRRTLAYSEVALMPRCPR